MNPFASLIPQVMFDRPTRAPRPTAPALEFEIITRSVYRPTGATAIMLAALQDRGELSSSELAFAAGIPAKQVQSCMQVPEKHGLVLRRVDGGRMLWRCS